MNFKDIYIYLIKKFRLINAFLTVIAIFISYRINMLYSYIKSYLQSSNFLRLYIEPNIGFLNFWLYASIFLLAFLTIGITILLKKKKKPVKFYILSSIFQIILLIFLIFVNYDLTSLLRDSNNLTTVMAIRDLAFIFYVIEFLIVIFFVIRTLGFDIYKFNFKEDLKDLDNENLYDEFELDVEIDSDDVKTKIKRNIRNFKYFILENKFLLAIAGVILVVFIGVKIISGYDKIYRENEIFNYGDLSIKVLSSYETTKNYYGEDITNNKYVYYIILLNIKNNSETNKVLNLNNISLRNSEYDSYSVDKDHYNEFLDIGVGYDSQKIEAKSTKNYILVFKVSKERNTKGKELKLVKSINFDNNKAFNYVTIKLKPINLDKVKEETTAVINEKLTIKDNIFGNVDLIINSFEIANTMEYSYEEKINNKNQKITKTVRPSTSDGYGKIVMRLKYSLESGNVSNSYMLNNFIGNFAKIRYVKNKKEYENPFTIREIMTEDNNYRYYEIFDEVKKADNIYLDIIIRNKKYIYKLK